MPSKKLGSITVGGYITFLLGLKKSSRKDGGLKMFFMLSVVYSSFYSSLFLLLHLIRVKTSGPVVSNDIASPFGFIKEVSSAP